MAQYRVYLEATASMTVTVEVDDKGKDFEQIEEEAIAKAFDTAPRDVCAQCSGWGQPWSLDFGEWESLDEGAMEKKES
jgi:hypothetical protein